MSKIVQFPKYGIHPTKTRCGVRSSIVLLCLLPLIPSVGCTWLNTMEGDAPSQLVHATKGILLPIALSILSQDTWVIESSSSIQIVAERVQTGVDRELLTRVEARLVENDLGESLLLRADTRVLTPNVPSQFHSGLQIEPEITRWQRDEFVERRITRQIREQLEANEKLAEESRLQSSSSSSSSEP